MGNSLRVDEAIGAQIVLGLARSKLRQCRSGLALKIFLRQMDGRRLDAKDSIRALPLDDFRNDIGVNRFNSFAEVPGGISPF